MFYSLRPTADSLLVHRLLCKHMRHVAGRVIIRDKEVVRTAHRTRIRAASDGERTGFAAASYELHSAMFVVVFNESFPSPTMCVSDPGSGGKQVVADNLVGS